MLFFFLGGGRVIKQNTMTLFIISFFLMVIAFYVYRGCVLEVDPRPPPPPPFFFFGGAYEKFDLAKNAITVKKHKGL